MNAIGTAKTLACVLKNPWFKNFISPATDWQVRFHPSLLSWPNWGGCISPATDWLAPFHQSLASWNNWQSRGSTTTNWRVPFHPSLVFWPNRQRGGLTTTNWRAACHPPFVLLVCLCLLIAERLPVRVATLVFPLVVAVLLLEWGRTIVFTPLLE